MQTVVKVQKGVPLGAMAARDSSGAVDSSWSGSEPFASVPEFPCCECQGLTHKQRFLMVAGRMERPAKCQCLTSSPVSTASDCSQSATSSSSPLEPNHSSNNQNTTNTTTNNVPPCTKRASQGREADDRAQKKPYVWNKGPFPLCAAGPDSQLWDKTESIWDCLACGNRNCPFESGTATLMDATDGQEMEYDESEPANAPPSPCPDWNRGTAYHFDKLSGIIKHLVSATFCSKGLWAHYKYLGRPYLELKMRTWMRWRMGTDAVEKNWVPLRRTVKECLRYRRQLCCEWMHEAWVGE